jgi:hypothetical protein
MSGRQNMAAGFLFLAGFMIYGFILITCATSRPERRPG